MKNWILIHVIFLTIVTNCFGQEDMLCVGPYWTEDEANLKMKEFAATWNDLNSWKERAETIKKGIIKGMKFDQMYPYIQRVYALYNAEHKIENTHFAAEKYDYGYSKRAAMYNFFAHHLKLNTGKVSWTPTINEDFVTILPPGELNVYSDKNPMPANALKGNKAITDYLDLK